MRVHRNARLRGAADVAATTRDGAPSVTLKAGASDGTRVRSRLQRTFVVTQVALSVLLLALAGVFLDGLYRAGRVELGFIADGRVLAGSVELPAARYDSVDARRFADAVSRELAALPGVVRVASATAAPLGESRYLDEAVPDAAGDGGPARDGIVVSENIVSPSYFATMGVSLAAGRVFDQSDATGGRGVVVVTRDFSQRAWPNQSPLGRFVQLSGPKGPRLMVIGVVNPALVNGAAEKPRPLVIGRLLRRRLFGPHVPDSFGWTRNEMRPTCVV